MVVMSTVNKDRKYTSGHRTEYAYLVDPANYEAQGTSVPEERYEAAKPLAIPFDFDAVDDIPADGELVQVLELFKDSQTAIALVLTTQNEYYIDGAAHKFRRVGICLRYTRPLSLGAADIDDCEFVLV